MFSHSFNKRRFFALAAFVLLVLVALVSAALNNFDFCGSGGQYCNSDRGGVSTLSAIDQEEEEVVLEYMEEGGNRPAQQEQFCPRNNTNDPLLFLTANKNCFECKSNCKTLFAASSCDRCTFPEAYYNRTITDLKTCFTSVLDLNKLSTEQQQKAKQLCIKGGLCTCQTFERFEYYMKTACSVECSKFNRTLSHRIYIQLNPENQCAIIYDPIAIGNATYQQVKNWCETGRFTLLQIEQMYLAQNPFNSIIRVSTTGINTTTLTPLDNLKRVLQLSPTINFNDWSNAIVHIGVDDELNTYRKALIYPEVVIAGGRIGIHFRKLYIGTITAGKTEKQIRDQLLNQANRDGFNSKNPEAAKFKTSVSVRNNQVSVSFGMAYYAPDNAKWVQYFATTQPAPKNNQVTEEEVGLAKMVYDGVPEFIKRQFPSVKKFVLTFSRTDRTFACGPIVPNQLVRFSIAKSATSVDARLEFATKFMSAQIAIHQQLETLLKNNGLLGPKV